MPGLGGADGTRAKEPNYVPDKADQDQKPGGFSLATGRPPNNTAAGALSTGKLESRRGPPGGAAAGAVSAGAPKLECSPPDGAAAGALSAGAIKLESTGRPTDAAAASALSAGTIASSTTLSTRASERLQLSPLTRAPMMASTDTGTPGFQSCMAPATQSTSALLCLVLTGSFSCPFLQRLLLGADVVGARRGGV